MILIIKGIIIGLGKILPGISGSLLAINLGEYDNIIESISNINKKPKDTILYLTKIGIGIIIAIALLSKIIVKCLNRCYFPTMLLFMGVIIGEILKQSQINKYSKNKILFILLISLVLIIVLMTLNINPISQVDQKIEHNINLILIMIAMGAIDAFASIVPGVSGTALLIMFGYYDIIIKSFSNIFKYAEIKNNMYIILPFVLGFIINTYVMSKIIDKIIKKYTNKKNIIILVLMTLTVIIILKQTINKCKNIYDLLSGISLLLCGIIISTYKKSYIKRKRIKYKEVKKWKKTYQTYMQI